jgi:hypothetical protein
VCFGTLLGEEGKYQEIMKKVEVTLVPRKECESRLRRSRLSDAFRLHESFLCAGGQTQNDTCVVIAITIIIRYIAYLHDC